MEIGRDGEGEGKSSSTSERTEVLITAEYLETRFIIGPSR